MGKVDGTNRAIFEQFAADSGSYPVFFGTGIPSDGLQGSLTLTAGPIITGGAVPRDDVLPDTTEEYYCLDDSDDGDESNTLQKRATYPVRQDYYLRRINPGHAHELISLDANGQ